MAITCCKGCVAPDRYPGCHSTCSTYIQEKAAYDARMAEHRKSRDIAEGLNAQKFEAVRKAAKRMGASTKKGTKDG